MAAHQHDDQSIARRAPGGWLPAAAVLFGAGWGSNQFTPMLLVYRQPSASARARWRRCSASTRSA